MIDNKDLLAYRKSLLDRLEAAAGEFRAACLAVRDATQPVEDGWNVHQIANHVRDVDQHVYGLRIRRSLAEENPQFENFDADSWMAEHYDPSEPLETLLDAFFGSVQELVAWLREQPAAVWSRPSRHVMYGDFAMQAWVERGLKHVEEHLETVRKAS